GLGAAGERYGPGDRLGQAAYVAGIEITRRPATEEHALDQPLACAGAFLLDVPYQRVEVALLVGRSSRGVGIEVAVRAFADAPGEMDVKRQRRRHVRTSPRVLRASAISADNARNAWPR